MQKFDYESLFIRLFSDASSDRKQCSTSQLVYIVLLCDKHHRANVLHFNSYESKRIMRRDLGREIYALVVTFDYANTMKHDRERILDKIVPLQMLTYSKNIFDMITNTHLRLRRN